MLHRVLVLLSVGGALVAACGGSDAGSRDAGRPRAGVALEGIEWVLDQEATALEAVAPQVKVTARFEGGRLSGNSGCNTYSTSYSTNGSSLSITGPIATTLMACEPPATNVERAYLELLPSVRSYTIGRRRLILSTATKGVAVVFVPSALR
jgi:heat shock protein HslJ